MEPKTIAVLIVIALIVGFFVWKKISAKKISEGGPRVDRNDPPTRRY